MLPVEGGTLAYETCGAGGRTIVLLHDGILHSAAWDDVWPRLCESYRVIRYDRRGYGASPAASAPYNPAKDLEQLLAATGTTRATLVGASAGGGLAVDFALLHPETVDGLVLVGPWVAGFRPSLGFTVRNLKLLALFKSGNIEQAAKDPYILTKDAAGPRGRVVEWLRAHPGNVTAGAAERFIVLAKPRLGEIKVPVLILVGEADIRDVREQAAEIATLIPGALPETVPAVGHFLYLEKSADFADRIVTFMETAGR
ncbi:MAG: alpha/beta hydrolase [Caulobacter sp.]|nr:alpha/beta hydrolase [Caulobacter sp.]